MRVYKKIDYNRKPVIGAAYHMLHNSLSAMKQNRDEPVVDIKVFPRLIKEIVEKKICLEEVMAFTIGVHDVREFAGLTEKEFDDVFEIFNDKVNINVEDEVFAGIKVSKKIFADEKSYWKYVSNTMNFNVHCHMYPVTLDSVELEALKSRVKSKVESIEKSFDSLNRKSLLQLVYSSIRYEFSIGKIDELKCMDFAKALLFVDQIDSTLIASKAKKVTK